MSEFYLASGGYWRNWERNVAWLEREINFIAITNNPYIKKSDKPRTRQAHRKLSIDKKSENKKMTEKEIKDAEGRL